MRKGWEVKNFGEVCELIGGNQPPKSDFVFAPRNGYVRLIQVRDYRTDKFLTYIPKTKAKRFCTKDDIMIGRYGPPIFGIFRGLEGSYNVALMKAVVNESICTKDFFYLFLKTDKLREFVEKSSKRAAGQDGVRKELLEKYPVPVPPISEQKRIVAILDKAFAAIEKAKQNTEYNLQSAKELFESYLHSVFANDGKGWEQRTLGDTDLLEIIDGDRGKNYPTLKDFADEGFCLFMNTKNVRPDGFDFKTTMFVSEKKDNAMGKGKLKRNDVVMTTRGTLGNLGVYNTNVKYEHIRINSGMVIFRPNTEKIIPEYLFEVLRSAGIKEQIKRLVTGAAQPQLPIKTLVNFTFPIPTSIASQQAIVKKLDALSAECKKLEARYQQKLNDLEELKKSILQKAFSGELTAAEAAVEV